MRYGRLPARIAAIIIFSFSLMLFFSGWVLQRQSVAILQKAIESDTSSKKAEKLRNLNKAELVKVEHDGFEEVGGRKKVAYVQQVDKLESVCNSVMIFADLKDLGSKARRVLYYPASWEMDLPAFHEEDDEDLAEKVRKMMESGGPRRGMKRRPRAKKARKSWWSWTSKKTKTLQNLSKAQENEPKFPSFIKPNDQMSIARYETAKRLLIRAATQYGARLVPVEESGSEEMMSPLYLFNMTDYSRVVHLDPVSMVMKNLDHILQLAPGIDVAATRAYWSEPGLSPNFFVVKPSEDEYRRVLAHVSHNSKHQKRGGVAATADAMVSQVLNDLYQSTAMVLPQMPYELLTSEFRSKDTGHERYLGRKGIAGGWNAAEALKKAYYVRFNDGEDGVTMPWQFQPSRTGEPLCTSPPGNNPCADRDTWNEAYEMFAERRRNVCGLDLEPADV